MDIRRLATANAVVLGVMVGALGWSCAQAGAMVTHVLGSSFGSFTAVQSIAIDESSGDVYVYDIGAGALDKFDAEGKPSQFSTSKEDAIGGLGGSSTEAEIAVDNSGGATQGDIYVANGTAVKVYGSNGEALGELNSEVEKAGGPWGAPCGVAVDAGGSVYVALHDGNVNKYTPSTNPVSDSDYDSSLVGLPEVCDVAADSQGNLYAELWQNGPTMKYQAAEFGQPQASGVLIEGGRNTLAVDSADQDLYIDRGESVMQFDASGKMLDSFGNEGTETISGSEGVAVDGANNKVYASDNGRERVDIFTPATLPDIAQLNVSEVTATSASVAGSVNPQGMPITSCEFGYLGYTIGAGARGGGAIESALPCSPTPGSSNTPVGVAAQLTNLVPNTEYFVRQLATNANGAVKLFVSLPNGVLFHTLAVPPAVAEQPTSASSITRTSAVLLGAVNPEHSETSYSYVYGPTAGYGRESAPLPAGEAFADRPALAKLEGLQPGTTYHYALIAHNQAGTAKGPDNTFTTAPATPPALNGVGVANLAPGAATILGTVETNGLPTKYEIQFGADTSYPTRQEGEVLVSSQGLSMSLIFLQPGTTYHYRVVASNEDGTVATPDQTFTTPPYQLQIPPVLPPLTTPAIAFPTGSQANTAKPRTSGRHRVRPRHRAKHVRRRKKKRKQG